MSIGQLYDCEDNGLFTYQRFYVVAENNDGDRTL